MAFCWRKFNKISWLKLKSHSFWALRFAQQVLLIYLIFFLFVHISKVIPPQDIHPTSIFSSQTEKMWKSFLSLMPDPRLNLIHAHLICSFSYNNERNPLLPLKIEFRICPLYCFASCLLKDLILLNFFSLIFTHPFYAVFFSFIFKHSVVLV